MKIYISFLCLMCRAPRGRTQNIPDEAWNRFATHFTRAEWQGVITEAHCPKCEKMQNHRIKTTPDGTLSVDDT